MSGSGKERRLAAAGLIVALTLLAYLPALRNGFIWDDDEYVTANQELRTLEGLGSIWFTPGAHEHLYRQYYPLVHTTFWIEYHLWQLNPLGYHLVNVLLHAACAVLLWRVLQRLQIPGAWFAAAVFAVHPVHVESVAWITERKNVLSGIFFLGAALAYLSFAGLDGRRPGAAGRWRWYGLAFGLFVCALLSKTVTCTLPAALLLVLWWKRGRLVWRDAALLLPFVLVGLGLGLTTAWLEKTRVGAVGPEWAFTICERMLIASRALCFYTAKIVWPVGLTFIYPRWDIDAGLWWQWMFAAAALAVLVALWGARRRLGAGPLVAVLFFACSLGPALGFVNVYPMRFSFVADHFQYLASAGMIALGAAAGASLVRRSNAPRVAAIVAAAVLGLLGTLTWRQTHVYADQETLWRDTLSRNPDCWPAHNNLGMALFQMGRIQEATSHFEQSLRINPRNEVAHGNLGLALVKAGKLPEGIEHMEQALAIQPDYAEAHSNLGDALLRAGQLPEAMTHLERALRIRPDYPEAHFILGATLIKAERFPEAIAHLDQGLQMKPDDAMAHSLLAAALRASGDIRGAIAQSDEALRLQPSSPPALNTLARIRATADDAQLRDGEQAVRLAERACQLTGRKSAIFLDTLAAAYAEVNRFAEAVATAQEAVALATSAGQDATATAIQLHLDLYRAGRPLREVAGTPAAIPSGL